MTGEKTRFKGIREQLREAVREELNGVRQIEDRELYEVIDRHIFQIGEREYLPLKERIQLRQGVFNFFRKLDILQQLMEIPRLRRS